MNNDTPMPRWLAWFAAAITLFHVWENTFGTLPTLWFNALHVGLFGAFGALLLGWRRRRSAALLWAGVFLFCGLYLLPASEWLPLRGEQMTWTDQAAAMAMIVSLVALCGFTSGWTMPVLVALCVLYVTVFGRYIEGVFHFRGLGLERVLYRFYFTDEGMFGFVTTLSATYVFLFVLFGAFLLASGAGEFIARLARWLAAVTPGGAAYVSVVSSGLMGTMNGSAVANTVATGSVTIPLMKQNGFSPRFAAGLETAASTGGQLLPPVMGAGAFVIAQYTGLSYAAVISAALLPALLYFFSLGVAVFLETRRLGDAVRLAEPPAEVRALTVWEVLREGLPFFCAVAALVALLASGFSPAYAACGAIAAVIAASWGTRRHRMGPSRIFAALVAGARLALPTAALLAATGMVIGTLNMTGCGIAFSQMLVGWSGGSLLLALLLVALASLVLGMGLPVTAAYVVTAVAAAGALEELGVALLAAHLLIFWLSQDSNVTPPVCLTAFAAAGVARCNPFAAGFSAWRLAKALYLIPLLFVYRPLITGDWPERLGVAAAAAAGIVLLYSAAAGWLRAPLPAWMRAAFLIAATACFWPEWRVNVLGALVLVVAWIGDPKPGRPATP